jgi:hypothetical protein
MVILDSKFTIDLHINFSLTLKLKHMKSKLLLVVFVLFSMGVFSQMRIVALHNPVNGVQYFAESQTDFQPFLNAYAAAVDGDTIYVSGGDFNIPPLFDKKLTIYGAGHYPSATTETQRTQFNSSITFGDNADASHIEGIYISGAVYFNDVPTHDIVIKRCNIESSVIANGVSGNFGNNCVFTENIIKGNLDLLNLRSCLFQSNMIFGTTNNATNDIFINNDFMAYNINYWNDGWTIYYANGCVFNNNIFCRNNERLCNNGTNIWNNNIFHISPTLGLNPIVTNSIIMDPTLVFISYSANTNFSYTQDYHLTATALTHLGTDGSQRGIYGGTASFKEESIPVNPHISSAVISPESTAGQINVNIQVQAQSR